MQKSLMRWAFALLCSLVAGHAGITDPAPYFLSQYAIEPGDSLLKLETDLMGNGRKQIFLSLTHMVNGKAGQIWIVYLPQSDGTFLEVVDNSTDAGGIVFRTDNFFVGPVRRMKSPVMGTFFPAGSFTGSLLAYRLAGNAIQCINIEPNFQPAEADHRELPKALQIEETAHDSGDQDFI